MPSTTLIEQGKSPKAGRRWLAGLVWVISKGVVVRCCGAVLVHWLGGEWWECGEAGSIPGAGEFLLGGDSL